MQRTKPPFRADEVGSLLRPAKIKEARAALEKGEISAADLRKIEDMEIEKVVHKQASIGLKLATDGEFRRSWWHFDFLSHLTGCELFHPDLGIQFTGVQTRHDAVRVIGKIDFPDDHPMLAHFKFLKKQCDTAHVTPKMTIPSPAVLHFRGGRRSISKEVYPDLDAFFHDLGKTYRKAVKACMDHLRGKEGCRRRAQGVHRCGQGGGHLRPRGPAFRIATASGGARFLRDSVSLRSVRGWHWPSACLRRACSKWPARRASCQSCPSTAFRSQ